MILFACHAQNVSHCKHTESYVYENIINFMLRFVWGIVNEKNDNTERKIKKLDEKLDEFSVHDDQRNQKMNDIDKRKE